MKLRPHHLLCTQGYSGKGYSHLFVSNMTSITTELRGKDNIKIELTFSTDDICTYCPMKIGEGVCEDDTLVKAMDSKLIGYFDLEEKSYFYKDIVNEINSKITVEIMDDICGKCSWYAISACRKNILSK